MPRGPTTVRKPITTGARNRTVVKKTTPENDQPRVKTVNPAREIGRKVWRKCAERATGHRCHWVGGILYFFGTKDEVPGVPHMPKPKKTANGWAAGNMPKGDKPQNVPEREPYENSGMGHGHPRSRQNPIVSRDTDYWYQR